MHGKTTQTTVREVFLNVRRFLSRRFPGFSHVELEERCQIVLKEREQSARAFMHVDHLREPHRVCTWEPAAKILETPYLTAIFLHEFGHLGSGKGELAADWWIMLHFGIPIEYKGNLNLEWVDPVLLHNMGLR